MVAKKTIEEILATGRRKTAVASIRLRKGTGIISVNGREFDKYFPGKLEKRVASAPIDELEMFGQYDLKIKVHGGGIQAQSQAIRLGLSRALVKEEPERRSKLKSLGFLRRDPRKKERKKYGLAGARKSFQFSKR